MKLRSILMASAMLTAILGVTSANAKDLTAAVGLGPKHMSSLTMNSFAAYMGEHTDRNIKVFPMSLLNLKETPPGLRDGLADIGFILTPYFPAEFAETNLAANLSMLSTTGTQVDMPGAAIAGAMTEYVFNCPDCVAEFEGQNQVYLGSGVSSVYVMLCTSPLQTLEDIKGKKFRAGAANFARWAEHFGGIAVSIPANDEYEGLSQGVIDCTMASPAALTSQSLFDVVKSVTLAVPGGNFIGTGTNNFNIDTWRGLTDDERKFALMGSARSTAELTGRFQLDAKAALKAAPKKGITVLEPSAELKAASDAFVLTDLKFVEQQFIKDYGIENVGVKITEFTQLLEKWKGIIAEVGSDQKTLEKVYWSEIYSKIDLKTYGMQ